MNKGLVFVLFASLFVYARCNAVSIHAGEGTQAGGEVNQSYRGNNEATDDERTPTNFVAKIVAAAHLNNERNPLPPGHPKFKTVQPLAKKPASDAARVAYVLKTSEPLLKGSSEKALAPPKGNSATHVSKKEKKLQPRPPTFKDKIPWTGTARLPHNSKTSVALSHEFPSSKKAKTVPKEKRKEKSATDVSVMKRKQVTSTPQVRASHERVIPHSYDTVASSKAPNPKGSHVNSWKDTKPLKDARTPTMSEQLIMQELQPALAMFKSHDVDPSSIEKKIERLRHEPGLQYDQNKYPFMALGSQLIGGKTPPLGDNRPKKNRAEYLVYLYFDNMDMSLKNLIDDENLDLGVMNKKMQWLVQEAENPEKHLDILAYMAAGDQLFVKFEKASKAKPGTGVEMNHQLGVAPSNVRGKLEKQKKRSEG